MFLTCIDGVVNWTVCPPGTADTMFTLGAMCRTVVVGPVGAAIVNWGVVPDCILAREVGATLIGMTFWIWICLLGEPPAFGAICCLAAALNGWTWTKVHVMLPPVAEFVCAPPKAAPARDKGVSLMGLPEITTTGGLDWAAVVTVLVLVVVPEVPVVWNNHQN